MERSLRGRTVLATRLFQASKVGPVPNPRPTRNEWSEIGQLLSYCNAATAATSAREAEFELNSKNQSGHCSRIYPHVLP